MGAGPACCRPRVDRRLRHGAFHRCRNGGSGIRLSDERGAVFSAGKPHFVNNTGFTSGLCGGMLGLLGTCWTFTAIVGVNVVGLSLPTPCRSSRGSGSVPSSGPDPGTGAGGALPSVSSPSPGSCSAVRSSCCPGVADHRRHLQLRTDRPGRRTGRGHVPVVRHRAAPPPGAGELRTAGRGGGDGPRPNVPWIRRTGPVRPFAPRHVTRSGAVRSRGDHAGRNHGIPGHASGPRQYWWARPSPKCWQKSPDGGHSWPTSCV